jgi:hypothetical protein
MVTLYFLRSIACACDYRDNPDIMAALQKVQSLMKAAAGALDAPPAPPPHPA